MTASAPPLAIRRRSLPGRRLTSAGGGGVALQLGPQVAHRRFRLAPAFLQRRLTSERGRSGRGAHPHPILRDPVQAGHPSTDQGGEAVDQEPFQYRAVADAEVGQRLGIHTDTAAQPLVGDVLVAQPRQLAGAADAIGRGIQPQRQQDARVRRRMARSTLHRLDRRHQRRHVQPLDEVPHHPDAVGTRSSRQIARSSTWHRSAIRSRGLSW